MTEPKLRNRDSVAVVVVTYNSADVIDGLIDSLDAGLAGVDWHLMVVDNGSTDGVVALVRERAPSATVVETGVNGGYAAGINVGVAHAPAHSAVLVLNPDVRLHPGCVEALMPALRQPGTGVVVPKLLDARGELIESQRRRPTVLRAFADAVVGARRAGRYELFGEVVSDPARYEHATECDWAEGSTLLISAECWQACGPWDESFFLYSEETDFALRAGDAGLATRYVPSATATHLEGGSGSTPSLWTLLVLNRVRLFRRRHGWPRSLAFWAAVLLRESSRALIGQPTSKMAARALCSPRRLRERPSADSIAAGAR